ncbi:MAG: redox-regulated ATPase YchF [Candidatus Gracilibacteria bacterium]|nr:redox-regulated ATPase YchF [Candidatus Gracilibacteria bacterium]
MSLQIGIVGLPNVGKSTLFNTLTESLCAEASNYPFCTIDPNVGIVKVPDERLDKLSELVKPEKTTPAVVEFVDIAGLVAGASKGEGLGNKFLANIRETDAICQVLRVFEDPNVTHVHGKVDPKGDVEVINTELIMADLETATKRESALEKQSKSNDKDILKKWAAVKKVKSILEQGKLVSELELDEEEKEMIYDLHLLTDKPFIYVANISEDQIKNFNAEAKAKELGVSHLIPISAKIESELAQLPISERKDFLADYGLQDSGLKRLIVDGYQTLGLQTYFTAGPQEVRAWTIHQGDKAPRAAGVIHTDFEKGFIKAEVCKCQDFLDLAGWAGVKEKGKMRMEGKEYVMQDGDVVYFHFNK